MGWLAIVGTIFQFALQLMAAYLEKDKVKKAKLTDILKDTLDAITRGDVDAVTTGFDNLRTTRRMQSSYHPPSY